MVAAIINNMPITLMTNGYRETFAKAARAVRNTIAVNNNPKSVIGGTIRSRVSASRSVLRCLTAENSNAGGGDDDGGGITQT